MGCYFNIRTKGTKKDRQVSSGKKTQITILGCASATGQVMPPMVVFTGIEVRFLEPSMVCHLMDGSGVVFLLIFCSFPKSRRIWASTDVILDGHSSHYTLDLVKTAAAKNVILFCLPPHTTADSQPLGTSCFGPLKKYWYEVCSYSICLTILDRWLLNFSFPHCLLMHGIKELLLWMLLLGFMVVHFLPVWLWIDF